MTISRLKTKLAMKLLIAAFSFNAYATQAGEQFILKACLLDELNTNVQVLAKAGDYRLVEMTLDDALQARIHRQQAKCGKLMNVSRYYKPAAGKMGNAARLLNAWMKEKSSLRPLHFAINHPSQVKPEIARVDADKIWQNAEHLTQYRNRSAQTKLGVLAAQWYKETFDQMAKMANRVDVASYYVQTGKYKQPSVVTVIGKDLPGEAVVIGAHIDTFGGNMPGADDDASGITVTQEIARVLLTSELSLKNPVYLIAYAAEERGLVGSGYVVDDFLKKKTPVKAVMQLDQAGYRANPKDKTIWLLTDYVDKSLTAFAAELLTYYVKVPVSYTRCGYACSDHAVWHQQGYPALYPSATTLDDDNPYVHTAEDRLEIINLEHMVHFAKLGLAFAIELSLD
ncbi:M28 family peptidase [Legionella sp. W05-934-2]|jgi:hypothetical protein|uniref:M28 family peptidase n=1 Tax=Legionella sp. W05-934-2 TaxID=1198649 RepID=UPI0034617CC0